MKKLRKRCEKCGVERGVRPRVRRCHDLERTLLGRTGYYCWGNLVTVKPPKPEKSEQPESAPEPKPKKRPQEIAAAKLAKVRAAVEEKRRALKRHLTALSKLEKQSDRLSKAASMSDEQVESERLKRIANKQRRDQSRVRRGIRI